MPRFFVVTGSTSRPVPHIYHNDPPPMNGDKTRLHTGARIIEGPIAVPAHLDHCGIDDLLAVWKSIHAGERPRIRIRAA
jgi:hypothetical protein